MADKVIIFGLEQFADTMYALLNEEAKREVVAFCTDKAYLPDYSEKNGLPVLAFEELEDRFDPKDHGIVFCIGYTDMNRLRKARMDNAIERGYAIENYVHPTAIIQAEKVGYGNIFMEGSVIGRGAVIGNGNIIWPMAHIAHHTTVDNYCFFTISVAVAGNVHIHDFCVFGANCTVKNNVVIEEGTLVGAAAYISRSTEAWSVYAPPRTYKLEGKSSLDFKL